MELFLILTKDENGYIATDEFKEVFGNKKLDDESWKMLIQEVDSNGDGKVL
jgi:Ca2+-binding EF-hand superfamily protein